MSEDGGSPRPVDPNAMDVDTVNSPPAVSPSTGEWKSGELQKLFLLFLILPPVLVP